MVWFDGVLTEAGGGGLRLGGVRDPHSRHACSAEIWAINVLRP
jgi:hypothetical protein